MAKIDRQKLMQLFKENSTPEQLVYELFDYVQELHETIENMKEAHDDLINHILDQDPPENGLPGKDADEEAILGRIIEYANKNLKPRHGRDAKVDYEIVTKALIGKLKKKKTDLSIFDLKDWEKLYRPPGNVIGGQAGSGTTTSGVNFEAPTSGIIDGINTTFGFDHEPKAIILNQSTYFEGDGYTRVGTSITFIAPLVPVVNSVIRSIY